MLDSGQWARRTPRLASRAIIGHVHGVGADQHGAQGARQVEGTQRLFLPVVLSSSRCTWSVTCISPASSAMRRRVCSTSSAIGLHATDLQAGPRVGIDHVALYRPHVLHTFDAPTIDKGKAQPGIEQRLHIPPGKVGTEGVTPVNDRGHPGREQVQRAQADDRRLPRR